MSLDFAHIQKTSLIDYPGEVSSTLFTVGCNMRCPFCHNRSLVIPEEFPPQRVSAEQALTELSRRQSYVGAVVITGGEPTIHPELPWFISSLKEQGFLTKLDTNGTNPEMLSELYSAGALDYVAMDIKSSLEDYEEAAGSEVDIASIKESADIIRSSGVAYEFRTTVVPGLHDLQKMGEIGKWLKGSSLYILQAFSSKGGTLEPSFMSKKPFNEAELRALADAARPYFEEVRLREYY
ncbi:anaerobic ribonucleoside-triphosphate reductase activating protein [Candidatus Micrarchaeota archaeon]|nr:anaerobic ribonucleoside-triphosphate reductase activating protein [Candidatus Micrarchaeota archaeon]